MRQKFLLLISIAIIFIFSQCNKESKVVTEVVADFVSDQSMLLVSNFVHFSDSSIGIPTQWEWVFEGGIPEKSNEQNPSVLYNIEGVYDVTLKVSNKQYTDEIIRKDYIEVKEYFDNGLVGHYKLNGDALDASNFKNHGEIYGDVRPTIDRFGNENGAMLFDGFSGYISVEEPEELKMDREITISVWINPSEGHEGWSTIVNIWAQKVDNYGYYLGLTPDLLEYRWNINNHMITYAGSLKIGEWTHLVAIYDGRTLNLYENLQKISEETLYIGEINCSDAPFMIGKQSLTYGSTVNTFYKGAMDDIYIYDYALSSQEIEELYNKK